jgi:PAS domain S-box-containing protein
MEPERRAYIKENLNRLFRAWAGRACLLGAAMFMVLSFLDYIAAPEYFRLFLTYRFVVSSMLVGIYFVIRSRLRMPAIYLALYFAIAFSAATIELMILRFGGHNSPYYPGMILLAVCAVVFVPAPLYFHLGSVLLIYAIYMVPILATERITEFQSFFIANSFLVTCLSASYLTSHFINKLLVRDFGLQYDLELEKKKREKQLSENLPGIVFRQYIKDNKETQLFNDMLEPVTGYTLEELSNGSVCQIDRLILPEDREGVVSDVRRAVLQEWPYEVEYRLKHKDGTVRRCLERGRPVKGDKGGVSYIDGIIIDITERVRAEEALRQSEEKYRALMDFAGDAIFLANTEGVLIEANKRAEELSGFTKGELLGLRFSILCPQEETDRARVAFEDIVAHGVGSISEIDLVRKDGSRVPVEFLGCTIHTAEEVIVHATVRDVSKRREAEEEKRKLEQMYFQTQKLEALGNLAGGIAHDFNNILAIIYNNLELARMRLAGDALDRIERSLEAVGRGKNMVGNLLNFSKGSVVEAEAVDLGLITEETVNFMKKAVEEDARIDVGVDIIPGLWNVRGNPSQLQQVVMNLYQNSREAIIAGRCDGNGRAQISFSLDNVAVPAALVEDNAGGEEAEYVRLEVTDSGCGMEEAVLSRVFEPFFSTKGSENRGIGLSAVYGIVRRMGGWIDVESEPGSGTTFRVYLPRHVADYIAAVSGGQPVGVSGGTETILVVDDERQLADSTREMLDHLGYRVLVAYSGEDALDLVREGSVKIDLIVTDMIMPRMSGLGLLSEVKALSPDTRVIITSGHMGRDRAWGSDAGVVCLSKPFTLEALAAKVRETIGVETSVNVKQDISRVKLFSVREKTVPYSDCIAGAAEIYRIFRQMAYEPRKKFIAVYLDSEKKIIAHDELTQGTSNEAVVHAQEIIKTALLTNAVSVVLVQNNPSGNVDPSVHDLEITSRVVDSCKLFNIEMLDHVIIGKDGYFSFADADGPTEDI